jgi:peptidoglycan/LPS O-acetylase OafA/YrhL
MRIVKLESIRGFVALYVVIHHYIYFTSLKAELPKFITVFFNFSQEAVVAFFLISGFVIYFATSKKHVSLKDYFLRRFFRIYPIAVCSIILSIIIALINKEVLSQSDVKDLGGNLLMLQDITNEPGVIVTTFRNNFPLWSLSYEWWFYLMFYPIYWLDFKLIYIVTILSLVSWIIFMYTPNHMLLILTYFALWWAGVASAEVYVKHGDFTLKNMLPVMACLLFMTVIIYAPLLRSMLPFTANSLINYRYPAHFYAASFLFILFGLIWWKIRLYLFDKILNVFSRLSSISYALYIIHFPLIWLQLPFVHNVYLSVLFKLSIVFLLSYLLEIKLQPIVNTYILSKKSHVKLN